MPQLPAYWTVMALVLGFLVGVFVKLAPVIVSFMNAKLDRDKFKHTQKLDRLAQFSAGVDRDIERFEKMVKVLQGEPDVPALQARPPAGSAERVLLEVQEARVDASKEIPSLLRRLTDLRRAQEALRKQLIGDPNGEFETEFAPLVKGTAEVHEQLSELLKRFVALPRIHIATVEPTEPQEGDLYIQITSEAMTPQGLTGTAHARLGQGKDHDETLDHGVHDSERG